MGRPVSTGGRQVGARSLAVVALAGAMLGACLPPPPRLHFDLTGVAPERWQRIRAECEYEALKATASAPPRAASEFVVERLFIRCVELQGVPFTGKRPPKPAA